MSKLETNTIDSISGTSNLTIGSTNSSTVTFESGAATGQNYPAFHAYLSSDQTLNNNTTTVVAFDAETFDTDSCFNTSTYRFTPNKAGKYQFSFCANLKNNAGVYYLQADLRKNGSNVSSSRGPVFENSSPSDQTLEMVPLVQTIIMDMNGSSDYIDVTAYFYNNGNGVIKANRTFINGFRLGA